MQLPSESVDSLELEELRSNVVAAQLGEEAIGTSLMAGAIGLASSSYLCASLYLIPGLAAGLALLIYRTDPGAFKCI